MNYPMKLRQARSLAAPVALAVALAMSACATTTAVPDSLVQARSTVQTASQRNGASGAARADIDMATKELAAAEAALGKSPKDVEYHAYLAQQSAQTAIERTDSAALREKVKNAETQRSAILLEARERDAKLAEQRAMTATAEATRLAGVAQRGSQELAQNQQALALNQQELARQQQELSDARKQIEDLQAKSTERGMVLTLGDVLFDTGSSTLKPGADQSLQRVADFLVRNKEAQVRIEGHTDAQGDDNSNQVLSQRRADTVAGRLMQLGVNGSHVKAMGLGEAYPVAGNDNAAGRQQNRRVELVFSDMKGQFVGAERTAQAR
jgi:outer membrane protein OmpA-like peptidoglycan-associated protein